MSATVAIHKRPVPGALSLCVESVEGALIGAAGRAAAVAVGSGASTVASATSVTVGSRMVRRGSPEVSRPICSCSAEVPARGVRIITVPRSTGLARRLLMGPSAGSVASGVVLPTGRGRVTYLNCGDWIENLTALEYEGGAWSIYRHREEEDDAAPVLVLLVLAEQRRRRRQAQDQASAPVRGCIDLHHRTCVGRPDGEEHHEGDRGDHERTSEVMPL